MVIALAFALPALVGAGLDGVWRLGPLGVLIGAGVGFVLGMIYLRTLAQAPTGSRPEKSPRLPKS